MRSMPGNPYDGHTVDSQIEQIEVLSGVTPKIALVDRGYRGVEPAAGTRLLKDALGDAMHAAILCGARHNLRTVLAHLRVLYAALVAQLLLLFWITPLPPRSSRWLA